MENTHFIHSPSLYRASNSHCMECYALLQIVRVTIRMWSIPNNTSFFTIQRVNWCLIFLHSPGKTFMCQLPLYWRAMVLFTNCSLQNSGRVALAADWETSEQAMRATSN